MLVRAQGEGIDLLPGELVSVLLVAPLGSAGTYPEYVAVSEDANLARLPKPLDPLVAAALPTAGVTGLEVVESLGPLAGKTVLIVGAAGGVGSFATQFATQAGAHVDASARGDAAARVRQYGAAETFDHIAVALSDAVRQVHLDGIHGVIDLASGRNGFASVASLVRRGGIALRSLNNICECRLWEPGVRACRSRTRLVPASRLCRLRLR